MRKLYFSFTTLMNAIYAGRLTDADLAESVFFMVRSHENVFSERACTDWMTHSGNNDEARARAAHRKLTSVLTMAMKGRRARVGFPPKYGTLNCVLCGLGLPSIFRTDVYRDGASGRTLVRPIHRIEYPTLRAMLAANCPQVELAET